MKCYLFDIDGTLADCSHRLHHISGEFDDHGMKKPQDWRSFFAACHGDAPIQHVIDLCHAVVHFHPVVLVSGRSDECRDATEDWLLKHGIAYRAIYMRKAGDHRPDDLVKSELLDEIVEHGFQPIMAFDDRDRVVKMWRERGIPCAQVAEGNF